MPSPLAPVTRVQLESRLQGRHRAALELPEAWRADAAAALDDRDVSDLLDADNPDGGSDDGDRARALRLAAVAAAAAHAATAPSHRRYPSISLLVPIAGSAPWQARLAGLRRQAEQRLQVEFGDRVDTQLLDQLRQAVDTASVPPGARSLAVYVNDTKTMTVAIEVDVRERTVIDDTFATRDLVAGDLRSPHYWVLALNLDDPRLLRGHGRHLYPVALVVPDTVEPPSGRYNRRGRDRTDILEARRTRRIRALDHALRAALGSTSDPLVVVGAEPTLSRFVAQTRHIGRVEGIVRRAPDRELPALQH